MNDQLWNCPVCGTLNSGDLYCGRGRSRRIGWYIWIVPLHSEDKNRNGGTIIDPDKLEDDPDSDYALNLIANFIKEAR